MEIKDKKGYITVYARNKAMQMRDEGYTFKEIGELFGINPSTLQANLYKYGVRGEAPKKGDGGELFNVSAHQDWLCGEN